MEECTTGDGTRQGRNHALAIVYITVQSQYQIWDASGLQHITYKQLNTMYRWLSTIFLYTVHVFYRSTGIYS